ncbi:MAG: bifunctional diaminohydroxyphosphoribosylaminopyrimidine deaminase/5-amino-6-(5-phosphoribosylamino)uracil reductase RibD, partial [Spirochaetes bacterium]|nr:bifunctional diaminohydroxyphosphoribosylaminopyrimidine deaminase/5-amino-6-(5-phosphoribosylamino)uracil reductase RibD [Spirochaetota bacterium]
MKDLREEEFSDFDKKCMARALSLARRGRGGVSPNPLVGAVVAKDGRIIGEGWHRHYGGKHAEPDAIDDAIAKGHALAGAHLYCNLEPCCYTAPDKHQPACTGIIIKNGIARVVAASRDPNPRVRGGGF